MIKFKEMVTCFIIEMIDAETVKSVKSFELNDWILNNIEDIANFNIASTTHVNNIECIIVDDLLTISYFEDDTNLVGRIELNISYIDSSLFDIKKYKFNN